jgi:hypothetical protein
VNYRIRVRGRFGRTMRAAFPGLHAQTRGGDTVLSGVLPDQAALFGVLARVEALGLELLEVRRVPGSGGGESPAEVTPPHPADGDAGPSRRK